MTVPEEPKERGPPPLDEVEGRVTQEADPEEMVSTRDTGPEDNATSWTMAELAADTVSAADFERASAKLTLVEDAIMEKTERYSWTKIITGAEFGQAPTWPGRHPA